MFVNIKFKKLFLILYVIEFYYQIDEYKKTAKAFLDYYYLEKEELRRDKEIL